MFFTRNRINSVNEKVNYEVKPNMSYVGESGLVQMMIESEQEQFQIFEAMIADDFDELAVRHGLVTESALQALYEEEGAKKEGFFAKIKAWLKNLWEKIKGFFANAWNMITGKLTKDNEKLVAKLKPIVDKKTDEELGKIKIKFAKNKDVDAFLVGMFNNLTNYSRSIKDDLEVINTNFDREETIEKQMKEFEDQASSFYADIFKDNTATDSNYREVFMNKVYEKEEEYTLTKELVNVAELRLQSEKIAMENLKKMEKHIDDNIKARLSQIDKIEKSINQETKTYKDDEGVEKTTRNAQTFQKALRFMHKAVTAEGQRLNQLCSLFFEGAKMDIKYARRIYIAAAGKASKEKEEEVKESYNDVINFEIDTICEAGAWV